MERNDAMCFGLTTKTEPLLHSEVCQNMPARVLHIQTYLQQSYINSTGNGSETSMILSLQLRYIVRTITKGHCNTFPLYQNMGQTEKQQEAAVPKDAS